MSLWRRATESDFTPAPHTACLLGLTCHCGTWLGFYPALNDGDEAVCEDCGRSWRVCVTVEVIVPDGAAR